MKLINYFSARRTTFLYPFLIISICLILIVANHTPNTILSGWDTLHPEFNFTLNFQRLIFGVFREEQGLGAVAAHAHMSDLPRVVLLWLSSLIFPMEFLRFFIISFCLPIGVFGVFYFLKDIIFSDSAKGKHFAFLGSLFYLFNLGTLQNFYVPFEMFTVGYAAIPWLFWSSALYLKEASKKNLAIFSCITLFASPMAYAPILWYVYFANLVLFLLFFIKQNFKQVKIIILLTILVNAFWMFPNLYFIFSGNAALVPEAKINKIFSEEAYTFNKSYGNITDAFIFKNFLFDWPVYEGQDQFGLLLDTWKSYNSHFFITFLGFLFAGVVLIGLFLAFRSKDRYLKSLIVPFAFCLVFLINSTWLVSGIFDLLRDNSSLFREALRFPFTKFSLAFMFISSVFFGYSIYYMVELLTKSFSKFNRCFIPTAVVIFSILLSVYMFPFFKGELISKRMQIQIPKEYFEVFNYLNKVPEFGRVAIFPTHTFWGWIYYNFGFQGAQFISFGIDKPVLERDYDRWNPKNEQYYEEMSYAVYTKDPEAFENVLKKYQIKYLMIDENIISPGPTQDQKILYIPEVKALFQSLESEKKLILTKKTEHLSIYEYNENFQKVTALDSVQEVNFNKGSYEVDLAFSAIGNYLKTSDASGLSFPFWPLHDNQNIINTDLVNNLSGNIILTSKNVKNLQFKNYGELEDVIPAKVYAKKDSLGMSLKFDVSFGGEAKEQIYQVSIDVSQGDNIVLNIDETQTIELKNLQEDFGFHGEVLLPTKGLTNLAFYKKSEEQSIEFSGNIIKNEPNFDYHNAIAENSLLKLCSASDKDQVFGYDATDTKNIKIASKNSQSCLWIPLEKILEQSNIGEFKDLLTYSFKAQTGSDISGRVCIYDKSANRCLKEKKYITGAEKFQDFFPINSNDLGKLDLVLYLDGINNQKLENFNYQDLKITVNKPLAYLTIDSRDIVAKVEDQNIEIDSRNQIKLSYGNDWNNLNLNFLESSHKPDNCGKNTTKIFERNLNTKENYLEFKTLSGSNCDYFSLPLAPHNVGYLVEIETQNLKGLPLRMCIANNFSKRCEVYLSLPKSVTPKTYLIAVSPTKDGGIGMDVHFDNYSVGNFETINRISNLKVYPFPYKFISAYHTGDGGSINIGQKLEENVTTSEIFPFLYKISTNADTPKYLTLSQSYENGWVLWGGKKHSEYNGWANIFEIDGGSKTMWIIYLPALLGLAGFLILLGIMLKVLVYPYLPKIFWKIYHFDDYRLRKFLTSKSFRPFY